MPLQGRALVGTEERMNIIQDIEEDGHGFSLSMNCIPLWGQGIDLTLDAANILKPALARGILRTVGATTQDEYQSISKRCSPPLAFCESHH